MRKIQIVLLFFIAFFVFAPFPGNSAELIQDKISIVKAKVLEVTEKPDNIISGTSFPIQNLKVEILEGDKKGSVVSFDNDYVLLEEGDLFYLDHTIRSDGGEFYSVHDPDRTPVLLFFSLLFVLLVFIFGGIQGLRGLLSLALSLVVIVFVLLPGILKGFSPLLISISVSSVIIILGSYITHGFNKTTSSAVLGMIVTVIVTGIMAYFAVYNSHLTGAADEEAVYLNFNTAGSIDLLGLLMGAIIIGLLGVLYDAAIGQSVAVEELHKVAPHVDRWSIYKRAIRIGREHIGALVDTLAIAYVGASLPLLLLFYSSNATFLMIINREIFATEIIRILIGSIGLVLAVPITTVLAVYMLIPKTKEVVPEEVLNTEKSALNDFHHKH